MNIVRFMPMALLAFAGSASAIDHAGASPATHMELKDGSGTIVCFAYDTDSATPPIAVDCPVGTYTEQLFDDTWSQIGERSVDIGDDMPAMTARPVRVERNCVWDELAIREAFRDVSQGDNVNPFCSITCPEGVAIDAEARGLVPALFESDDTILDNLSYTRGTGEETIVIFVVSDVPLDVVFDRFELGSEPELEGFGDLTYVVEAAAVCL